jgi:4-hydroxy-tetrahydrodipicolinate reductase
MSMRVGVFGAGGRIGAQLIKSLQGNPRWELAAALVSPHSPLVGTRVAGCEVEYRPFDASTHEQACDVIVDFSKPAASLSLQQAMGAKRIPVVIGTTGFSDDEDRSLSEYAQHRPMLVSANFARGFEVFRLAAGRLAASLADGDAVVAETYHARKKNEPSGTSRLLAGLIRQERSRANGVAMPEVPIVVHREGDVVGINEVQFDIGSAEILLSYRVNTLAAYAEGALIAAEWLVSRAPPSGRFSLADTLSSSLSD